MSPFFGLHQKDISMKTILFFLATLVSNNMIQGVFRNTAQPLVRQMARKVIRYSAKVFTVCLIGALTFVSGLVMTFSDMGTQLSNMGALVFSPQLGFGLGLTLIGAVCVYLGAFSEMFSPWKEWERERRKKPPESSLAQVIEVIVTAMNERAQAAKASPQEPRSYHRGSDDFERNPPPVH